MNRTIRYGFLFLVGLAPLPFGMVHSVVQAFFACCVLVLAIVLCTWYLVTGTTVPVSLTRIWPETGLFVLIFAWGTFQLSPLSPVTWHHPLWNDVVKTLGIHLPGSIALARPLGLESLLRIFIYGVVFWLALQLGRNRRLAPAILWTLVLSGTCYATYGLIMHFSGLELVLWVKKRYAHTVTGTFINRNHFATYTGLCLLCAVGLYLSGFLEALHSGRRGRDKLIYLLRCAFVRGAPLLACVLILLTALFLTNSRGGVTASLIAVLVLIIFLGLMVRVEDRIHRILIASVLVAGLAVFFLSGDGWLSRLMGTNIEREQRLQVYREIWEATMKSPWLGYGIGNFEKVFAMFTQQPGHWDKGHCDWLEMIFELGIPMAIVWFMVPLTLAVRCLFGFFRRHRDHLYPVVGFCASLLIGVHALVDFSLQIPAVAVTYVTILGVSVAQSWSSLLDLGNSRKNDIPGEEV